MERNLFSREIGSGMQYMVAHQLLRWGQYGCLWYLNGLGQMSETEVNDLSKTAQLLDPEFDDSITTEWGELEPDMCKEIRSYLTDCFSEPNPVDGLACLSDVLLRVCSGELRGRPALTYAAERLVSMQELMLSRCLQYI